MDHGHGSAPGRGSAPASGGPAHDSKGHAGGPRCGFCGRSFTELQWRALTLAGTLGPAVIARHVVHWAPEQSIEIRRCSGCGRDIARTTRGS